MEPKGPNMDRKRAQMEPKGPNIDQKGAESGSKNIFKTMPAKKFTQGRSHPDGGLDFWSRFGHVLAEKVAARIDFGGLFWYLFLLKMLFKIYPEIEPQKIMKMFEKTLKNLCEK